MPELNPSADRAPLVTALAVGRRDPQSGGWLLRDVSFDLHPGERLALCGPSGSGKTLLLRALALLDPIDAGTIAWRGRPIAADAVPEYRRQVVYLHQRPALFEGTVEENLRQPFALRVNRGRAFDKAHVLRLLSALGRDAAFLDKAQRDLSGGEAQIVALLRAVQLAPAVLLLDEPTAALDAASTRAVEELVRCWQAEAPGVRASIWVSHDPEQANRVADHRLLLNAGRVEGQS